jgi:cytidylate kinase
VDGSIHPHFNTQSLKIQSVTTSKICCVAKNEQFFSVHFFLLFIIKKNVPLQKIRMVKIISITGDLGSGKSTVSKLLLERLGYDYIYTGNIQREIAKRYNMTTLELNKYSETHPEIDEEIDATVKSLNNSNNLIIDSRLAWFFIPESFKVFLKTDVEIAAKRISEDNQRKTENYSSEKEAVSKIIARKESEHKRYTELYGIDSLDLSNFDLVIDTSFITPEEVANTIITEYNIWLSK